jgi:O-antigen/teichoic acid export membrane protein
VAAAALGLGWAVVLFVFDIPTYKREFGGMPPWRKLLEGPWREQGARLKGLFGLAYALGITALLGSLRPNVPRYLLEAHAGAAELGVYAALAYFSALGGRVVQALGQVLNPRLGRYHAAGDQRLFGRTLCTFTGGAALVGVCAIAGAALLGRQVLTLFYGAPYAHNLGLFVWLMVAAALEYVGVSLQFALTAARELKAQMVMLVVSVAVVAVASWWWVPRAGPLGAAWALALGWCTELSCSGWLTLRAWRRLGRKDAATVPGGAAAQVARGVDSVA